MMDEHSSVDSRIMGLDLLSRVLAAIPALPMEYLQCSFYDAPLLNPSLQIIDIEPHRNYRSKAEFHGKFSIFWNIDSNLFEKIEWPILLNEAITLLGEVGYLVIATRDNENGALFGLKNLIYRHPLRRVELIDQFNIQNGLIISVIRIEKISFDINPSKNWSFVFLSNGKKAERIKSTISQIYGAKESFETLNKSEIDIEILVLGPRLDGVTNLPVRYFDEFIAPKDDIARIGAKKNFGLSMARNPNVCLLHDRFSLDPNFFNNFDAWGYDFDYLTVEQYFDSGEKFSPILGFDEFSYKKIQMFYYENSYQYHPNGYINGGFIILKKYLHQFCNFNPLLLHLEAEDIEIANVLINFGIVPRVNMYTFAKTENTPVLNNLLRNKVTILNILIPMAGKGLRFAVEGYDLPKPLIDVNGLPMIQLVIENIKPKIPHQFIFICLEDHVRKHNIDKFLLSIEPTAKIVLVNQITGGAAETAMLAAQSVDQNMPLLIANSDQYLNFDINHYINFLETSPSDANIMTMNATGEKWSYIKKIGQLVSEVAEKKEISTEATVGIYFFKHGRDFFRYAKNMIEIKDKTLGEYYVAMVYNYLIRAGLAVDSYNVGNVEDRVYGLGTPSDLRLYLKARG